MPINPYKPGAGYMPSYLAGRNADIDNAQNIADTLLSNQCARFTMYYGLRGVGKTVLLNYIEEKMKEKNITTMSFECLEGKSFSSSMAGEIKMTISRLDVTENLKSKINEIKKLLSSFELAWNQNTLTGENSVSLKISPSTNYSEKIISLREVMLALGEIAHKNNTPICLFVDEMQYMSKDDLAIFIEVLHKIAQKNLPIGFLGAGLPKILKFAEESKTYSERLFDFVPIDSLKYNDAKEALIQPAQQLGVFYDDDAADEIFSITKGYPYFIQEYGNQVWDKQNNNNEITKKIVNDNYPIFIETLDRSFFKARLNRTTPKEKEFMCNMVLCGKLPCNISDVANHMGREVKSISPFRANLINKGLIYDTEHGMIDFTVPQFDEFLKRVYPDLQNKNSNNL